MRETVDFVRAYCWIWMCVLVAGCLAPNTSECGDRLCARGTMCAAAYGQCVTAESMTACAGLPDEFECSTARGLGVCRSGVCVPYTCGDGIITAPEECDGANVGAQTCLTAKFYDDGPVTCTPDCTLDTSQCTGFCGDDMVQVAEACDGADVSCQSLGYYDPGVATCTQRCTLNASACSGTCGDDIVNGQEVCDGSDPLLQCAGFGFDYGATSCTGLCGPNLNACGRLGWHLDPPSILYYASPVSVAGNWAYAGTYYRVLHRFNDVTTSTLTIPGGAWDSVVVGVWGRSDSDLWAATSDGFIFHYDGTSFTQVFDTGGVALGDLHGTASGKAWAVGAGGAIYQYDGAAWGPVADTDTVNGLAAVFARTDTDVIAVGAAGTVVRFNGSTWEDQASTATGGLTSVWAGAADDVYVAGAGVFHWNGAWSTVALPIDGPAHVTGTSSENVFVAWTKPGEYMTPPAERVWNFDGASWAELASPKIGLNITSAAITPEGQLILGGGQGIFGVRIIYARFHNVGLWATTETAPAINGVWAAGRDFVVGAGYTGSATARIVVWDGSTFIHSSPLTNYFRTVGGWDRDRVWAASSSIFRWDPGTTSWVDDLPGTYSTPYQFWAASADDVYIVAFNGIYRRTTDAWTLVHPGTYYAMWGTSPSNLYAVGADDKLARFNGSLWQETAMPVTGRKIWGSSPTDIYVIAGSLVYHFDGANWSSVDYGEPLQLYDIGGTGPDDVYLLGDGNTLLHWQGTRWSPVNHGLGPEQATFTSLHIDTTQWVLGGTYDISGVPEIRLAQFLRTGPGGIGR